MMQENMYIENLTLITKGLEREFSEAAQHLSKIDRSRSILRHTEDQNEIEYAHDLMMEHEGRLGLNLGEIRIRLIAVLSVLGLRELIQEFTLAWQKHAKNPTQIDYEPDFGESYNPALETLRSYFVLVRELIDKSDDVTTYVKNHNLHQVAEILRGTPKALLDRAIIPENEADVRRCIYDILCIVFPDTIREFPLPQSVKTYRPDIGVPSLGACIEYKYATTVEEVKSAVDGIAADIPSYADHKPWDIFFAVFYLTDAFYTEAQVKAHFDKEMIKNWVFIVVNGKGIRAKKKSPKPSKKKAKS